MKVNTSTRTSKTKTRTTTHEGGRAKILTPEKELERAVLTCMLFEETFYESGSDMAKRISDLCKKVSPEYISKLAVKARSEMHMRSISLFLVRELVKLTKGKIISETLDKVIQRADELSEFLAMYWLHKKQPLSAQVKKGLAKAFTKFNAYQLGKYNRDAKVKLRDVLFLCHAKPKNKEQAKVWKKLVDGVLESPDTWEVALSSGANKKETFERLIKEGQLGYFALLRNLRNMEQAGCDIKVITKELLNEEAVGKSKVLPFRFLAAYNNISNVELKKAVEKSFLTSTSNLPKLNGVTYIVVDVSGSMEGPLSSKSEMSRMDAAAALAAIIKEHSNSTVYTFSNELAKVSSKKKGMEFIKDVINSQQHGGTDLRHCLSKLDGDACDRVIVLTDEQSHDGNIDCWAENGYIINMAGYKPSVTYTKGWEVIAGWSDKIVNYINAIEKLKQEDSSA